VQAAELCEQKMQNKIFNDIFRLVMEIWIVKCGILWFWLILDNELKEFLEKI